MQIDEKSWISRDSENLSDDENKEYRDIRTDYPGVDDFVQKEELGYRIGMFLRSKPPATFLDVHLSIFLFHLQWIAGRFIC